MQTQTATDIAEDEAQTNEHDGSAAEIAIAIKQEANDDAPVINQEDVATAVVEHHMDVATNDDNC